MTSLIVFLVGGPLIKLFLEIKFLGRLDRMVQLDHIIKKSGTPTMGGIIIIIGMFSGTILWADLSNIYIWVLFSFLLVWLFGIHR